MQTNNGQLHLKQKQKEDKIRDLITIFVLLSLVGLFSVLQKFDISENTNIVEIPPIITSIGVVTIQHPEVKKFVKPRSKIPLPAPDDDVDAVDANELEFLTYDDTIFKDMPMPPPPELTEDDIVPFMSMAEKPQIIGGMQGLYKNLKYPPMAKRAGVSGRVILKFICNKQGKAVNIKILQEKPKDMGFGNASLKALKKVNFTPGIQRDVPVNVSMSLPIFFKIK